MATSGGQQRLDWYAVPGVPLTLILDTADGSDWPSAPRVLVGPREADGDITPVLAPLTATITATPSRATLTLTDAQMATILTAYPVGGRSACPWHVRLGTGESETAVSTGYLIWDVTGHLVTTSAQLVVGPRGVSVSSMAVDVDPESDTYGHLLVTMSNDTTVDAGAIGAGVTSVAGRSGVVALTAADLTDSTAVGRALLTAATTAAQRGALGLGDGTITRDPLGRAATVTGGGVTQTVVRDAVGRIEEVI